MELDELKSTWNATQAPAKTAEEIQQMLKENNHPVLRGIRKQLLIETTGWSAFLLVYYTMFDGDQKPLLINAALVLGLLLSLVHNLTGYGMAKYMDTHMPVKRSLERYLSKVKVYALISVVSRVLLWAGFVLFFTYNIRFTPGKYLMLAIMGVVVLLQLMLLSGIWSARLRKLKASLISFI